MKKKMEELVLLQDLLNTGELVKGIQLIRDNSFFVFICI